MRIMYALALLAAFIAVGGTAQALPVAVGPVGVSCTGPSASASAPPPDVQFTPPSCSVTGGP